MAVWVHAHNVALVSKNVAKNLDLKQRRKCFDFSTIRFVSKKQAVSQKKCKNHIENGRVMLIRRSRAKVVVGLFWTKWWPFWPYFLDINFQFVFPIIHIRIDGQTNFEVNQTWPMAILAHKNPKKH